MKRMNDRLWEDINRVMIDMSKWAKAEPTEVVERLGFVGVVLNMMFEKICKSNSLILSTYKVNDCVWEVVCRRKVND